MRSIWMLLAVALVGVAEGGVEHCEENEACKSPDPKYRAEHCQKTCTLRRRSPEDELSRRNVDEPIEAKYPDPSPPRARRSYAMEHFRWGKPVGGKRRPVRAPDIVDDEGEFEDLGEALPDENGRVVRMAEDEDSQVQEAKRNEKAYDDERQKPLQMLLKNVINKDEQS